MTYPPISALLELPVREDVLQREAFLIVIEDVKLALCNYRFRCVAADVKRTAYSGMKFFYSLFTMTYEVIAHRNDLKCG